MKKLLFCLAPLFTQAQVLSPIAVTGYTLDAVAEATTAMATTGGAIDGSNYVMYSVAYGTVYTTNTGLPNNGLIASGTRTYQLEPYTLNNTLYVPGLTTGSLVLTTPASYAGLSLLGFATEGGGTMNITIRFTDNSTQVFNSQVIPDWFGTGSSVISGFDRCTRNTGTPNFQTTNPKMFPIDLPITCTNRGKLVADITIQNTGSNSRLVFMAVSGAAIPSFSVSTVPVSCSGGSNGSASITPTGGLPNFSYTVNSTPPQFSGSVVNLPAGVYSYTAQDVAACPVTGSFNITQSLVTQPSLSVTANATTVCAGTTVSLTASGASTYTWTGNSNGPTLSFVPGASTVVTVQGLTQQNCLRTGNISITVNPLPQLSTQNLANSCITQQQVPMSATPQGGTFSGPGVQGSFFSPPSAGTGTHTILYTFTDQNNCTNTATFSAAVYSLAAPAVNSGSAVCMNSTPFSVTVSPTGGNFGGPLTTSGLITTTTAGVFPFTYSITDGPCEASSSGAYTVLALPSLTFSLSKTQFCLTNGVIGLNASPGPGSFSGPGVNGFFFAPANAGPGTHTITYSYTNTAKCSSTTQVVVKVQDCSGVSEQGLTGVIVFPNPSGGQFRVFTGTAQRFTVTDVLGKTVSEFTTEGGVVYMLDLTPARGIYFLRSADGGTRRLIVE